MSDETESGPEVRFFREDRARVEAALRRGEIDFADGSRWPAIDQFFAFLFASQFFAVCAQAFPDPRKKRLEVPLVILLSAYFVLRLHDQTAFSKLPYVLAAASNLFRVRFNLAIFSGEDTPLAENGGFNRRNKKPRRSIFDQDTARKFFRRVDPESLKAWFNAELAEFLSRQVGKEEALLILDASLLPMPDNDHYENTHRLPLNDKKQRAKDGEEPAMWRPCYKLTSLLRTGEEEGPFVCVGASLDSGEKSEQTTGWPLVHGYLERHAKEIEFLLIDRGFLDGEQISEVKTRHDVDVIVPLKSDMNAVEDIRGLMKIQPPEWKEVRRVQRKEYLRGEDGVRRESGVVTTTVHEVAGYHDITSWESCRVPLSVAVVRETKTTERPDEPPEVAVHEWFIASTEEKANPARIYRLYEHRVEVEERYRQLKEVRWWAMSAFTSTKFSLVASQVYLTLAVYSLHQVYLVDEKKRELTRRTIDRLYWEDRLAGRDIIVYAGGHFAIFETLVVLDLVLKLEEEPRARMRGKVERLMKGLLEREGGPAP